MDWQALLNYAKGRTSMASTPEKKVKETVKKTLDSMGIWHFSPFQAGMGRAGIPDIIACYRGLFVGIECKAGNNKPTALQEREIDAIRKAKGLAFIINEDNMHNLKELLQWNKDEH
jgi:Holliday junction resolvase